MPKAPFGARAWRRPVGGSILSRITRILARFTIPSPFGHEIGQLADAMTRRTRDCSPDAMGVVPTWGRDHALLQQQEDGDGLRAAYLNGAALDNPDALYALLQLGQLLEAQGDAAGAHAAWQQAAECSDRSAPVGVWPGPRAGPARRQLAGLAAAPHHGCFS